ncbi:MAG: RNA polymerase sigma factor [Blastocatellia bacterium]
MELSEDLAGEIQQSWHRFLQRTEALRPELYRYCRSLTGSVWDAEDLVQDTLLRGFAKLGEFSNPIDNPKAYLFRIATNLWTHRFRRPELPLPGQESKPSSPEQAAEVRDAAKQLMNRLAPQERAAVVLKDVLDFRLEEIAVILQSTVGAIKSALHRGREKLATPESVRGNAGPSKELVDQFVEAFNARDLDRLTALLLEESMAEVVGIGTSYGRNPISESSLYYSLFLEKGEPRAERRSVAGEELVVFWYSDLDDSAKSAVREVLRIEELDGQIARLRYYTFCPETVAEICGAQGLPMAGLGYGVWSAEFLSLRKEEEFLKWRERSHPHWDEQARKAK